MKTIIISDELHKEIKILAIQQNVTMQLWCQKALQNRVDSVFGFSVN